MLAMTRYSVKNECLIPWVKFIWHLEQENADIHNKLLPMDSIDIILNLSSSMVYEVNDITIPAPSFHINSLGNKHSFIHQTGSICIFGISLYPYGLFPFVHKQVTDIRDRIVDLNELSPVLTASLQSAVSGSTANEVVFAIENALCAMLIIDPVYITRAQLIQDFINMEDNINIQEFCSEHRVNIKTFERWVLQYTGYTPKILRRIKRFQVTSNQLVHQNAASFTDLAYYNGFADQAHLIKEFRHFSGKAPKLFQQEKISVKENAVYSYI